MDRIERMLADDPENVAAIRAWLTSSEKLLDIAALGEHQRDTLTAPNPQDPDRIRIAVVHHHLLPDPGIEVSQFEAVLDAGKVLEKLLDNQYDLVLSGHKHNRRLAHYETGGRRLDVYTAPRLLKGKDDSEPGFTIIDVHGPESPEYAVLHYYKYERSTFRCYASEPLVREGRVLSAITQTCVNISRKNQEEVVEPVLKSLKAALDWESHAPDNTMFPVVWKHLREDLANIASRRFTFRHPELWRQWNHLIEAIDPTSEIRVVSENDLEYWKGLKSPLSEASKYAEGLRNFDGKKTRIWIIDKLELRKQGRDTAASKVLKGMVEHGFRVLIVHPTSVRGQMLRDFGIIGDIAVTWYEGMEGDCRAITESFNPGDMERAITTWNTLYESRLWDSWGDISFDDWLKDE
jgi:hypothetical protein